MFCRGVKNSSRALGHTCKSTSIIWGLQQFIVLEASTARWRSVRNAGLRLLGLGSRM